MERSVTNYWRVVLEVALSVYTLSRRTTKPAKWYVRLAKTQILCEAYVILSILSTWAGWICSALKHVLLYHYQENDINHKG